MNKTPASDPSENSKSLKAVDRFNKLKTMLPLGVVIAYVIYFLILHPHPGFPKSMDYTAWFSAGKMVVAGEAQALYDLKAQARFQEPLMYPFSTPGGLLVYSYPPFFVLPFIPLSLLPFNLSYVLWVFMILVAGAFAMRLIIRDIRPVENPGPRTYFEWTVTALAFFPVFQGILLGQTSLLELLILAGFYLALRRNKPGWAGGILALGAFKPQLLLFFVPVLLFRKATRGLIALIAVGIAWLAISIALVGVAGLFDFAHNISLVYNWNCTYGVYPEFYQSWRGLLIGFMVPPCTQPDLLARSGQVIQSANQIANGLNLLSMLVVALAWLGIWKRPTSSAQFDLVFALTIVASILASPYSNPQELTRLVLMAALVWRARQNNPQIVPRWLTHPLVLAVVVLISPLVMTPLVRQVHPMVWVEILFFIALAAAIFKDQFAARAKQAASLGTTAD